MAPFAKWMWMEQNWQTREGEDDVDTETSLVRCVKKSSMQNKFLAPWAQLIEA